MYNWEFVRSRQPGISIMFSLATLVYKNEYKAQSNCNICNIQVLSLKLVLPLSFARLEFKV
jgi:hypothetical protein